MCSRTYTQTHSLSHTNTPHQWHSGNAQNWKTGGARFKPRSRLSTWPFGVFRRFLRNPPKYGLGSLRKTPHGGQSTYSPRSQKRATGLKPTTNHYFSLCSVYLAERLAHSALALLLRKSKRVRIPCCICRLRVLKSSTQFRFYVR